MKALLDTNILIHRETSRILNENIGELCLWLDKLGYIKCAHTLSLTEIEKYQDEPTKNTFRAKLKSYELLELISPMNDEVQKVGNEVDVTENDKIDTKLLNELYCGRVDLLITEDRKIFKKAYLLGLSEKVRSIDGFLEWAITENPKLQDYKIKNIRIEKFGKIDVNQPFFESLRLSYDGFNSWYLRNYDSEAYICGENNSVTAFLSLKVENSNTEDYSDINPIFPPKKRLKVRTLKVVSNGYKIGERFIKIIFDNAINNKVEEIYVTVFPTDNERKELIRLFEKFGFIKWGFNSKGEDVYVRDMKKQFNSFNPFVTYPYYSTHNNIYLVTINERYHTSLFPDSILSNENPVNFEENKSFANAIHKLYLTRAFSAEPKAGDLLLFYRSGGGRYRSVVTTIGVVCNYAKYFKNFNEFYAKCQRRSALTRSQMVEMWNRNLYSSPRVIDFMYIETLPKKLNLNKLIELGFDSELVKNGIIKITENLFDKIVSESSLKNIRLI